MATPIWAVISHEEVGRGLKLLVASLILILAQPLAHSKGGGPSPQIQVDGFGPGFGQTLDDVMAKFGMAAIWHAGDASEAEYRLCYVAQLGRGRVVVIFSSSAMASKAREINAISVAEAANHSDRKRCTTLHQRLNIQSPVRLGMPKSQVKSLFVKGKDDGTVMTDDLCTKKYMEKRDPLFARWVGKAGCFGDSNRPFYDECRTSRVKFDRERVVLISYSVVRSVC